MAGLLGPSEHPARFLRALWQRGDRFGLAVVSIAVITSLVSLTSLAVPSLERHMLARQQVQAGFFGHVSLLPLASMYTYDHLILASPHGLPRDLHLDRPAIPPDWWDSRFVVENPCAPQGGIALQVQHFPGSRLGYIQSLVNRCGADTPWTVVLHSEGLRAHHTTRLRLSPDPRTPPERQARARAR